MKGRHSPSKLGEKVGHHKKVESSILGCKIKKMKKEHMDELSKKDQKLEQYKKEMETLLE